tara:strand:- start:1063 stop:1335 length:273 start_codon:yes stop_codon:yes gene_type:complete
MREIDRDLGKIYHIDDYYYLEKIFDNLYDLIEDERRIKIKSKKNGFLVKDYSWSVEDNPNYIIASIINDGDTSDINEVRFVFKIKLEYTK